MGEPLTAAGSPRLGLPAEAKDSARTASHGRSRVTTAVTFATAAYGTVFATVGILLHEAFATARYDLGNYVQAIHNTAHGRLFETTTQQGEQVTRLGIHVEPVLLLIAPLWRLWPSPHLLIVLQALVLAAGALPTYWLARKHLSSERHAAVFAAAYLLYPATQWNAVSFHAVALAPPLILFALWFLDEDRVWSAAPFLVLAAGTKEHMPLLVAWVGVCYWILRRRHRAAALIVGASLAWLIVAVFVVMPHFEPPGLDLFAERYGELGGSPGALLDTLVRDPFRLGEQLDVQDLAYGVFVGLPLCFLWLLRPLLAVGALPEYALSVLSSKPQQTSISAQYTASLIPFLVAASVLGAASLSVSVRRRAVRYLIGVSILAGLISPAWSAPFAVAALTSEKRAAQKAALALIPEAAPVTATNNLGAHLAERRRAFGFPQRAGAAWVVVDLKDPFVADIRDERLFEQAVKDLRRDLRFRLVFSADAIELYARRRA